MELFEQIVSGAVMLVLTIGALAGVAYWLFQRHKARSLRAAFERHFKPISLDQISTIERQFPFHIRADLQQAIDEFVRGVKVVRFLGVRAAHRFESLDFATLFNERLINPGGSAVIGPPQYEQLDIGAEEPLQALQNGLWLLERGSTRFALLYVSTTEFGGCGPEQRVRLEVATGSNDSDSAVAREFFQFLETAVSSARCYRGKILSLEQEQSYFGHSSGIKVHRLGQLSRDQVILPQKTLELLDRNVIDFVVNRANLSRLQMATKKGLLFYGPPGTGKTHTIRYLAGSLKGHTTLLISAEQVALLSQYMTLARLLQPSIVVIEDVDLIARERTQMQDGRIEILLNKLLNEMDGLKEDCEILFILTTNRPQDLEAALASRPGRIDQAIEFPLPDEQGRAKLVRLYSRGLMVSEDVVQDIVKRTKNVSASFIKELMRRSAQFHLAQNGSSQLAIDDVQRALDEMLFSGGSLNLKLLGADTWNAASVSAGSPCDAGAI